ncbi:MAG: retroviral-like aspartic protease family protein [Sphingomicrobium sp.]
MAWKTVLFVAVLASTASGLAQSPVVLQAKSGPVDSTTQAEDVAFRDDSYQRMTVPVLLSGSGPFRFMVDTGADRTAISRQLAQSLNLAAGANATLHSVAGVSRVETATVPDLQLSRKSVRVVNAPLLEREHMGADGILGVDSLRSQRIQFDFEHNIMSIAPSASADRFDEPDAIVITATRRKGRLIFTEARINGRPVTVVLDTGSQVTIGNRALRQMLTGRSSDLTAEKVELHSVTGATLSGNYLSVRELDMGGVSLKGLAVVFADAHTFRKLDLERKPALLLGMNAIRAFKKVSIDFATRKFRVVVPESSALEVDLASGQRLARKPARVGC